MRRVAVGDIVFGAADQFVLIAGPCVIENEHSVLRHAELIVSIARELGIPYVFKCSYDKANRSSIHSFRGPGLIQGLRILSKVKKEFRIPILSDVHHVEEVGRASEVLDILQVPAFLSRQTDLLVACGKTKRAVNVKKGQFLSPWEMKNVVEKIESTGNKDILLTERGVSFGYQNLVSDFRSIPVMQKLGYPVVFDVTHSVQLPGGLGHASGGQAEFIPTLARCAVASGADALFMEVHEDPAKALSDGPNNLKLSALKELLKTLKEIRRVAPVDTEPSVCDSRSRAAAVGTGGRS